MDTDDVQHLLNELLDGKQYGTHVISMEYGGLGSIDGSMEMIMLDQTTGQYRRFDLRFYDMDAEDY